LISRQNYFSDRYPAKLFFPSLDIFLLIVKCIRALVDFARALCRNIRAQRHVRDPNEITGKQIFAYTDLLSDRTRGL